MLELEQIGMDLLKISKENMGVSEAEAHQYALSHCRNGREGFF